MDSRHYSCDVLIVGGGPAGLAAGSCAAEAGANVTLLDDNPGLGGQIWRGEDRSPVSRESAAWFKKVQDASIRFIRGARVFDQPEAGVLLGETLDGVLELEFCKLILATGARERFLPFPGWTLPNVMGAGGLQALVKSGLPIAGKKVVVAGSGPLVLAVAAHLRKAGANILLIAEQAPWSRLLKFGLRLFAEPGKAFQAMELRTSLHDVPYFASCWPVSAEGKNQLAAVTLRQGNKTWKLFCDYLACGFHLVPNLELAAFLGCELQNDGVRVGDFQETSVAEIYCAGETTGIGGLELSLVEGRIAGYAAAGQHDKARKLFTARRRAQRFAGSMKQTFSLRDELKSLPLPETIVCRCEDVAFEQLNAQTSWREAKLQTRCGMGPCQGRICGAATEFLFGWKPDSIRPPVFPVRLESLTTIDTLRSSS